MELCKKLQKWIDSILIDNLKNVAIESKDLKNWNLNPKLNKMIFRALLCLSHTAVRTKISDIKTGEQIFYIADQFCLALTDILDSGKYFSSLYHIIRKLIAMQLYSKAAHITVWSLPHKFKHDLTSQHIDMYLKIANLWHEPGLDLLNALPESGINKIDYKLLIEMFTNELRVLEVAAKERSAYVLSKVLRYLKKLDTISNNFESQEDKSHRHIAKNFFKKIRVVFKREEKYDLYHDALGFITFATTAAVNPTSVENAVAVFIESYDIVETIFATDSELCESLEIYRNMGVMLIDESKQIPHWELGKIEKRTISITKTVYDSQGPFNNMKMIGYMLESLSERWQNCIITGDKKFLNVSVLRCIIRIVRLMFEIMRMVVMNGCEVCVGNTCKLETHLHTVIVVSIRTLVLFSKISALDLLKDVFPLIKKLLEETLENLYAMKTNDCAQWSSLWTNCGILIYNLSVVCHKTLYEESVFLFSLLCSSIVTFEGINTVNSKINIKNPLSHALHRLSSVHYNHGHYREALTPCALNGLLSYENSDSKAFRMWANIKQACVDSESITKMSMISCLRKDMDAIREIEVEVNLDNYDLSELCLQELRGLHNARGNLSVAMQSVLDEMQSLNSGGLKYVQGVHLLGYHQLHYRHDENFHKYYKQAAKELEKDKFLGDLHVFTSATQDFYTFIMNLCNIVDQTKAEMETSKFALRANKPSASLDGQPQNNINFVPAFTKINITEESKLFLNLKQALHKWSTCIENNVIGIVEKWHLELTLRTLVIVAEYTKLHKFSTLERKAWELSFKLACQLKDHCTCVYVIGRGTSLRNLNEEWINIANDLSTELGSIDNSETHNALAFFWISLSNLYFDIGKQSKAARIIQETSLLPNISPTKNVPAYLLGIETILRHCYSYANENPTKKYTVYLVKCLYTILSLLEWNPIPKIGIKVKQLCSFEVVLTVTASLALRMNSFLSFKEISSHLIDRMKLSQASGVPLRTAECLKNLCFIDLSRMQLNDCIVKLQGLEFILQTEYIEESQNTKNPKTSINEMNKPGSRDSFMNDGSPVLRKTVFQIPDFINHRECSCYKCNSFEYQYLVASNTHIRAQLYFLQGHLEEAMTHFNGAFFLRRKMLQIESCQKTEWEEISKANRDKLHLWKDYSGSVEYVQLLLDFSRFIRKLEFSDASNVANEAVRFCERFNIQGHPIYIAAKELLLEYQFCEMFKADDFNAFTVPDPDSIDISKYVDSASSDDLRNIRTPASKPYTQNPRAAHRRKTPPLLKLTKVSIDLNDDEDAEGSESPKSSYQRSRVGKNYRRPETLTRKKLQCYLEATVEPSIVENKEGAEIVGDSQLEVPKEVLPTIIITLPNELGNMSEIINKAVSLFPNLLKPLMKIDRDIMNESEKIERIIELLDKEKKKTEVKSEFDECGYRTRLSNKDRNSFTDMLITSFQKVSISNENAQLQPPLIATNHVTSSFGDEIRKPDTSHSNNKVKKKLQFAEEFESISDIKEPREIQEPEHLRRNERVRTSDRIKKSQSQSGEVEQKKFDDHTKIVPNLKEKQASGNCEINQKIQDNKQEPSSSRRIQRSQSKESEPSDSSLDVIEDSQFNESDVVPNSDVEEKSMIEARKKGILHKYKTRSRAQLPNAQSQIKGTSSKLKSKDNSNGVSTSDPNAIGGATKCKSVERKRRFPR